MTISPTASPVDFGSLFAALLDATRAYSALLDEGIDQDDQALSRSTAYAELLRAGLMLHHQGGVRAVTAGADYLSRCFSQGSVRHFSRLWAGLMADLPLRQ